MQFIRSIALTTVLAVPYSAHAAEFNGPFVGAQVGWQSEKFSDPESSFGLVPIDDTKQSVTGGIYAGYDRQVAERVVVGAEAGLDFAEDDSVETATAGVSYSIDPKYSFDLTARAGYLVNPETLLYVRGGYTNARIRTTMTNVAGTEVDGNNQDGWLVGPGVERRVGEKVSARLEYRYSKLTEGDGQDQRNRVLAGLSYRF